MVAITGALATIGAIAAQLAVSAEAKPAYYERAIASTSIVAPEGYSLNWTVQGKRPTVANTSVISLTMLDATAQNVTQAHVNNCTSTCTGNAACQFATVMTASGSTKGQVQCALYPTVLKATDAKYTTAAGGGKVKASYAFSKVAAASQNAAASSSSLAFASSSAAVDRKATVKAKSTSHKTTAHKSTAKTTAKVTVKSTILAKATTTRHKTSSSSTHHVSSHKTTSTSSKKTSKITTTSKHHPTTTSSTHRASVITTSKPVTSKTTKRVVTTSTSKVTMRGTTSTARFTSTATTTSTSYGHVATTMTQSTSATGTSSNATTTTSAKSTPTLTGPSGASLVQLNACGSGGTIPAFANSLWANGSSATVAYISQHGSDSALNDAFTWASSVIGTSKFPLVAPGLYTNDAQQIPYSWYNATTNIAWGPSPSFWSMGQDAVQPASISSCSSFDVIDYLLEYYSSNTDKFPNLEKVVVSGFSAGANLVSRYSTITDDSSYRFAVRYVVISAASQAYFSTPRPWLQTCSAAFRWPYQWVSSGMPRYVANRFASTDADSLLTRWLARDVVSSVGTADVDTSGNQDCGTVSSGGPTRSGRNYGYWAYKNMAAGTSTNVTDYPGYGNLTTTGAGVPLVPGVPFTHQNCIVSGIQHDGGRMYASNCVSAALIFEQEPTGVQPPSTSAPSPTAAQPDSTVVLSG